MREISAGFLPVFKVPGTHHHLMFDEPIAVAMAIKAMLLDWRREDGADAMRRALAAVLALEAPRR